MYVNHNLSEVEYNVQMINKDGLLLLVAPGELSVILIIFNLKGFYIVQLVNPSSQWESNPSKLRNLTNNAEQNI
jgi:hypothetical protein